MSPLPTTASTTTARTTTARTLALAVAGAGALLVPTACGPPLSCSATVSNSTPYQNSRVYVSVHTKSWSGITTVAHYASTNTTKKTVANSSGAGVTFYDISRATRGHRVNVSVAVDNGPDRASCSTYFTPK